MDSGSLVARQAAVHAVFDKARGSFESFLYAMYGELMNLGVAIEAEGNIIDGQRIW